MYMFDYFCCFQPAPNRSPILNSPFIPWGDFQVQVEFSGDSVWQETKHAVVVCINVYIYTYIYIRIHMYIYKLYICECIYTFIYIYTRTIIWNLKIFTWKKDLFCINCSFWDSMSFRECIYLYIMECFPFLFWSGEWEGGFWPWMLLLLSWNVEYPIS